MKITPNSVVTVSYIVTDDTDQVVGRTDPKNPIEVLVGHNFLVPGLEKALDGHVKGDEFAVKLEPKDAFGDFNEGLVQTIDRALFGDFPIQVGNAFEADTSAGPRLVVIKEINESTVVVDGNHPLAGKTLNFMVVVEDVREATEDELAHGHAHHGGVCPSESHHCGCGHHGGGCCGGHGHGDHECGCGHHHEGEDHECCGGHGDHECGCGHHHDGEDHECCGGHGHGDHECGCGHHHEGEEHECCGGHGHSEGCGCSNNK